MRRFRIPILGDGTPAFIAEIADGFAFGDGARADESGALGACGQKVVQAKIRGHGGGIVGLEVFDHAAFRVVVTQIEGLAVAGDGCTDPVM